MKVLVCIPCLLTGGTEIQTLSLVEALVKARHDVTVACYFEHAAVMVERYRRAGAGVELMSPEGVRPAGVRATVTHLWRGLRRAVRSVRPDVAHVQYMAPGAIPIVILRLLGVKNIIATAHTAADIYPSLSMIHRLNRHVLHAFQCITLRAEQSFFGSSQLYAPSTPLSRHGNHFTIYNALPSYITPLSPDAPRQNAIAPDAPARERRDATCRVNSGEVISGETGRCVNNATRRVPTIGHQPDYQPTADPLRERRDATCRVNSGEVISGETGRGDNGVVTTIGVVSRLELIKGMDLVVPAFAAVHRQYPSTRLLVVGDGSQRQLMERQVADAGLADAVTFAGRQPQDALQSYYDLIDILLMPSRSEGFGLTAIEGMARGCVPVVADTGGLPEVVIDGISGILHRPAIADYQPTADPLREREQHQPGDMTADQLAIDSIANAVGRLVADPQMLADMSRAASSRAVVFSPDRYNALIDNLYSRL